MSTELSHAYAAPRWAQAMRSLTSHVTYDAPGPKVLKFA